MYKYLIVLFASLLLSFSADAQEFKKVSLQLQWKHQFQFAGYYVAKEKGFYEQENLAVDIREFDYGMSVINELREKRVDFGVGRPTVLISQAQHQDLALLATIFQSSPNVLIAKESSGIKTIEDFKNKKIMVTGDAQEDALIMAMIRSNGVHLGNMQVLDNTFNIDDLINNKTDLLSSYISNEPYLLKEKGVKFTIFDPKEYGFDFYNDILFTSQENLYKNYKDVKNFTLASIKGWEYAFNNINETVDIILKKYNTQGKSREALIYEAHQLKKLAYYKTDKLGKIDKARVKTIHDYYKLMKLSSGNIDTENFVFNFSDSKYYLNKDERQYLKKKQTIKVCIDPSWMPFESFDKNGKHRGISRDYFDIFEKDINTKFEAVKTKTWSESIEFAKLRKCDIFSLSLETAKRREYMDFTLPYINVPLVIATNKDVQFIDSLDSLQNAKIGIPKDYAFLNLLRNEHPQIDFIEVKSIDDGLKKVSEGKLFGYVGTLISIGYKFQTEYIGQLKIAGKVNDNLEFRIATRNDEKILQRIMQKAINNISQTKSQEILNKWVSIKYENGIDYTLVYEVLIVFSLILLVILFFMRKLQSMNKKLRISNKQIEKLAITDKLTKLYNRHKIDEVLENEKKHADRYESLFGIIILDLDHFKNVNDTYGHNIGDITLQKFSTVLLKNTREVDILGRWGGEEFIIIVHNVNENSLMKIAENLRTKIESTQYDAINHITASLGLTIYKSAESIDNLISRADDALYLSKNTGRNRCSYK